MPATPAASFLGAAEASVGTKAMSALEDIAVVRVQFNDEWIVRFHVRWPISFCSLTPSPCSMIAALLPPRELICAFARIFVLFASCLSGEGNTPSASLPAPS